MPIVAEQSAELARIMKLPAVGERLASDAANRSATALGNLPR
jgi:hypothetical protein